MDTTEFKDRAFALVGAHEGWRSRIARRLDLNDRTVRRWLANDDVPDWVAAKLPEVSDAWIIGDGVAADGVRRNFVLHVGWPAFVGWVPPDKTDELRVLVWLDMVDEATAADWRQLALEQFHKREARDGRSVGDPAAGCPAGAGGGTG